MLFKKNHVHKLLTRAHYFIKSNVHVLITRAHSLLLKIKQPWLG